MHNYRQISIARSYVYKLWLTIRRIKCAPSLLLSIGTPDVALLATSVVVRGRRTTLDVGDSGKPGDFVPNMSARHLRTLSPTSPWQAGGFSAVLSFRVIRLATLDSMRSIPDNLDAHEENVVT